ncbi:hypothetical protein KPL35_07275 [Clostridium sp. CF011]|uniref:hypothetical protein n=1 Tax=unclassified Clostridium TaxID=2614128 RepID=UPI001C0B8892|nr:MULTISPECIES: hypothetical protein [unclassified Clostridium]MBU3091879.1 hypothetical protein [Clostridium sp. CF011]MBW9145750.1 hypothetical protein [Clostridium sp. CM027]UVE41403.1 hypothetical protein KTC92_02580 [Clostridium sp. CM027]WAG70396.1 hypothetical protein LL036_02855 [Clostridium sp. CF011]
MKCFNNFLKNMLINDLERKAYYESKKILEKRKPIYVSRQKWLNIRKVAIDEFVGENKNPRNIRELEFSTCYKFLNNNKPSYINNNEWDYILKKSTEVLEEQIKKIVMEINYYNDFSVLLGLNKPQNIKQDIWNIIQNKIFDVFILLKKYNASQYYFNTDKILDLLKEKKQNGMLEDKWLDYYNFLKELYLQNLLSKLYSIKSPIEFINNHPLEYLEDKKIYELKHEAYRLELLAFKILCYTKNPKELIKKEKPAWIKDIDFKIIVLDLKGKIEIDEKREEYKEKLQLINGILKCNKLQMDRPKNINEEDWSYLFDLDKSIKDKIDNNKKNDMAKKLIEDEEETKYMKKITNIL